MRRSGFVVVVGGCLAVVVASVLPLPWSAWAVLGGAAIVPGGFIVLTRPPRGLALGAVALSGLLLALGGCLLTLGPQDPGARLLGLPVPSAVAIYGLWLVPLLPLALAFGLSWKDDDG